jgi:hypothetical protein
MSHARGRGNLGRVLSQPALQPGIQFQNLILCHGQREVDQGVNFGSHFLDSPLIYERFLSVRKRVSKPQSNINVFLLLRKHTIVCNGSYHDTKPQHAKVNKMHHFEATNLTGVKPKNPASAENETFILTNSETAVHVSLALFRQAVQRHGGAIISPEDNHQPPGIPATASIHLQGVIGIGLTLEAAAQDWIKNQSNQCARKNTVAGPV